MVEKNNKKVNNNATSTAAAAAAANNNNNNNNNKDDSVVVFAVTDKENSTESSSNNNNSNNNNMQIKNENNVDNNNNNNSNNNNNNSSTNKIITTTSHIFNIEIIHSSDLKELDKNNADKTTTTANKEDKKNNEENDSNKKQQQQLTASAITSSNDDLIKGEKQERQASTSSGSNYSEQIDVIPVDEGYATRQMDEYFRQTIAAIKQELTRKMESQDGDAGDVQTSTAVTGGGGGGATGTGGTFIHQHPHLDHDTSSLDHFDDHDYEEDEDLEVLEQVKNCIDCSGGYYCKIHSNANTKYELLLQNSNENFYATTPTAAANQQYVGSSGLNNNNITTTDMFMTDTNLRRKSSSYVTLCKTVLVLSLILNHVLIDGYIFNCANLYSHINEEFIETNKIKLVRTYPSLFASLPIALLISIYFLTTSLALYLSKRYKLKHISIYGTILASLSILVSSSITTSYITFVICFSLFNGVGMSLIHVSSMLILSEWSYSNRLFINTLIICSSGLGICIYPLISDYLLTIFKLFDTLFILSAIQFNFLVSSLLLNSRKDYHGYRLYANKYHIHNHSQQQHHANNTHHGHKHSSHLNTSHSNNQNTSAANNQHLISNAGSSQYGYGGGDTDSTYSASIKNFTIKQHWRKFCQTSKLNQKTKKKNLFLLIAEEKRKSRALSKVSLEDGFVITTSNNLLSPDEYNIQKTDQSSRKNSSSSHHHHKATNIFGRIAHSLRSLTHLATHHKSSNAHATTTTDNDKENKDHDISNSPSQFTSTTTPTHHHHHHHHSQHHHPPQTPIPPPAPPPTAAILTPVTPATTTHNETPITLLNVFIPPTTLTPNTTTTTTTTLSTSPAQTSTNEITLLEEKDEEENESIIENKKTNKDNQQLSINHNDSDSDSDTSDNESTTTNNNTNSNQTSTNATSNDDNSLFSSAVSSAKSSRYMSYRNSLTNSVKGSLIECSVPEDQEEEEDEDNVNDLRQNQFVPATTSSNKQLNGTKYSRQRNRYYTRNHANGDLNSTNDNNNTQSGVNNNRTQINNSNTMSNNVSKFNCQRYINHMSMIDTSSLYNFTLNSKTLYQNINQSLIRFNNSNNSSRSNSKNSKNIYKNRNNNNNNKNNNANRLFMNSDKSINIIDYYKYLFNTRLLCNTVINFVNFCFTISTIGMVSALMHIIRYVNFPKPYPIYVLSVIGITSALGRVISTIVYKSTNENHKSRMFAYNFSLILIGIITLLSTFCTTMFTFILFAIGFGGLLGFNLCLRSVYVYELIGLYWNDDSLFNIFMFGQGIGVLLGLPISGLIFDLFKDVKSVYNYAGGLMIVSGVLTAIGSKCIKSLGCCSSRMFNKSYLKRL